MAGSYEIDSVMKNKFNDNVIATIKRCLPDDEQLAPFLGDLLFLGKEAIYRRIRGDVVFTFDELATISLRLGFSIDSLAGIEQSERRNFDANLHLNHTPEDAYYHKLLETIEFFMDLNRATIVKGEFVSNHIPYVFCVFMNTMTKFRYYKWMHHSNAISVDCPMSELIVPAKILEAEKEWRDKTNQHAIHSTYMFDSNLFITTCRDIDYFYRSNLLNEQEVQCMQGELLALVDYFEEVSRTGVSVTGLPLNFYLIPFDLGANYMYFEYDNNKSCLIHIHTIEHLRSLDPHVCELQKNWIDVLKRYSIYITQSGEMQRLAYFKKQREHISMIGQTDA